MKHVFKIKKRHFLAGKIRSQVLNSLQAWECFASPSVWWLLYPILECLGACVWAFALKSSREGSSKDPRAVFIRWWNKSFTFPVEVSCLGGFKEQLSNIRFPWTWDQTRDFCGLIYSYPVKRSDIFPVSFLFLGFIPNPQGVTGRNTSLCFTSVRWPN